MKINVVLEKKSKFNIDLPELEAKNLYKKLVGSIVESLKIQPIEIKPTFAVNVPKTDVEHKDIEKLADVQVEVISQKLQDRLSENPGYKKLIMIKCPSCGEIATPVLYVKDGELQYKNKHLTCRHCQNDLPLEEIKPAKYMCPNCGINASFYIMGDLQEVHCRDCKSVIDLIWNDKKKQYMSPNLIR